MKIHNSIQSKLSNQTFSKFHQDYAKIIDFVLPVFFCVQFYINQCLLLPTQIELSSREPQGFKASFGLIQLQYPIFGRISYKSILTKLESIRQIYRGSPQIAQGNIFAQNGLYFLIRFLFIKLTYILTQYTQIISPLMLESL